MRGGILDLEQCGESRQRGAFRRIAIASVVSAGVVCSALVTAPAGAATAETPPRSQTDWAKEFAEFNSTRVILSSEAGYAIGTRAASSAGIKGDGVGVALVDTGVAPLSGLTDADAVINGPDLSLDHQAGMPAAIDANGHGTHLAGIIASRKTGIAPGSHIVNLKVGAADGAADVSQVIAAIDWAVTHRNDPGLNIRVLNLAFGTDSAQSYRSSPLTHAVESAWRNGIVVVVAAGNSGAAMVNPAIDPFVLAVGAADINDPYKTSDDERAEFSAVGTNSRGVDLLAPGVSILGIRVPGGVVDTEFPGSRVLGAFTKGSGTSQSAAIVSGAVALLLEKNPSLTPDQVKAILKSTATPLAGATAQEQGAGRINLTGAFAASVPAGATQTFTHSTGTGSIDAARGSARLVADDGTVLRGEVDLQGNPWKGSVWAPKSTAGKAWTGGSWNGAVWAGSTWLEDAAGNAVGLVVDGVEWAGRVWRSEIWSGRVWRADLWAGRVWRAEIWDGRVWRSDGWE